MYNAEKRLVYYCDANEKIGLGHLSRGVKICNYIEKNSENIDISISGNFSDDSKKYIETFLNSSIKVFEPRTIVKCDVAVIDTMDEELDLDTVNSDLSALIKRKANTLIAISSSISPIIPYDVDVLIDHVPGVLLDKVPDSCERYLGLDFAPVSGEFIDARDLYSMPVIDEEKYKLLVVGGHKTIEGPEKIIRVFQEYEKIQNHNVVVILSPVYKSADVERIRNEYTGLKILQNVHNFSEYVLKASRILTTYGHTTYESLSGRKPTYSLGFKKFQNDYADSLEKELFLINLGYVDKFDSKEVRKFLDEPVNNSVIKKLEGYFFNSGIQNISKVIFNYLNFNAG